MGMLVSSGILLSTGFVYYMVGGTWRRTFLFLCMGIPFSRRLWLIRYAVEGEETRDALKMDMGFEEDGMSDNDVDAYFDGRRR
jgi:hypothetical protein